jgi:diaminohydroxyphosphoribosylaminopyrimidine deaminase / 5-amino-6-(5-phosphoribosylamino)uracil reductase
VSKGRLVVATDHDDDTKWMLMAIALSEQARGTTSPNPNVGCVIVKDGKLVGV